MKTKKDPKNMTTDEIKKELFKISEGMNDKQIDAMLNPEPRLGNCRHGVIEESCDKCYFLEQAEVIKTAVDNILSMGNGQIVNEVGLSEYPFEQSLDEVHARLVAWCWAIAKGK